MTFLAATKKDDFRKPNTGMWDFIVAKNTIKEKSFYCGDAAGRPRSGATGADHSADDMIFARNVGLSFYTPESFFLGQTMKGV